MAAKAHTALERYKNRRGRATAPAAATITVSGWRILRLVALLLILSGVTWWALHPRRAEPVQLTYEIDLSEARQSNLVITIVLEGRLPDHLDLAFPPGVFGDDGNGVTPRSPSAHELDLDGKSIRPLAVERTDAGWRLGTKGVSRTGFIYRVELDRVAGDEEDIRRHISTPVAGGLRAAGFEIFLEPLDVPVGDITVALHNPLRLPVLVPWPALIRDDAQSELSDASLGFGQGFRPATGIIAATDESKRPPRAAPVPQNLFFHPRDLADLNNALIVCGDIRTYTSQAGSCVIQLATDRHWLFADDAAVDLVRRIARTEMGFFGSAPTDQITVLLSSNDVTARERFDVYGVHTGSSVLVLMDPGTTWGEVEEQAASVVAHEMFHGWLGEAIPQTDPSTLWFTEGATTWYAARMLATAGIWSPDLARATLQTRTQRDYAENALLGQISLADAAADVAAPAEQVRFAYAGGVSACMALDEMLARASGMQRPLDEVLRRLYNDGDGTPLSRELIETTIDQVTGVDCATWLDAYVYGKTVLPPVARVI